MQHTLKLLPFIFDLKMHQFTDINYECKHRGATSEQFIYRPTSFGNEHDKSRSHNANEYCIYCSTTRTYTLPNGYEYCIYCSTTRRHAGTCTLYVSRILNHAAYIRSDQAQTYTASGSPYFVAIIQKAREIMRRKDCKFKPAIATRLCYVNLLLPLYMHNKIVASYVKIYNIAS